MKVDDPVEPRALSLRAEVASYFMAMAGSCRNKMWNLTEEEKGKDIGDENRMEPSLLLCGEWMPGRTVGDGQPVISLLFEGSCVDVKDNFLINELIALKNKGY